MNTASRHQITRILCVNYGEHTDIHRKQKDRWEEGLMQENELMKENGWKDLAHIGLWVTDIEETKKFYQDILGFEAPTGKSAVDQESGITTEIVFLQKGNLILECICQPGTELPDRGRIEHIAIATDQIEQAVEELSARGVIFDGPIVQDEELWSKGVKYITFRGPSGERLELNQVIR